MKFTHVSVPAFVIALSVLSAAPAFAAKAEPVQLTTGRQAILSLTGCYLVDYSYVETEGLQPGYVRDSRVYDVNKNRSVKEWIYAEEVSPARIRLQHILFATELSGRPMEDTLLKHTGEDWEFEAAYRYEFVSPLHWEARNQRDQKDTWTRRITSLDDGLRFQCSAPWKLDTAYADWSCGTYAPIPGREFRDMGRKDYQGMERWNRLVAYGHSWLEREENVKIIQNASGKTPLAKELGKNWYVRLPDAECSSAISFAEPRKEFWRVIRESWDAVFTGDSPFTEKTISGQPGRYNSIMALEDKYMALDLRNPAVRAEAKREITDLIEAYRER